MLGSGNGSETLGWFARGGGIFGPTSMSWHEEYLAERVALAKRTGGRRWDPRPWHSECGEYDANGYPGFACGHPGAVQGALEEHGGKRVTFIPEGHPRFPDPPPWTAKSK